MTNPYPNFRPRKWVYVAGPFTKPDPVVNARIAILAGERLNQEGLHAIVPHVTLLQHFLAPHSVEYWYEYDLQALIKCDALLRLPGESVGSDREVAFAKVRGIPVFHDERLLLNALAGLP